MSLKALRIDDDALRTSSFILAIFGDESTPVRSDETRCRSLFADSGDRPILELLEC